MPTTTPHASADLPPAYSSSPQTQTQYHPLPAYTLSDQATDRGNYAFAITQHNLMFNTDASPTPSSLHSSPSSPSPDPDPEPERPPSPAPGHRPTNPKPDIPPTSRAQRAALRDFHATQNPDLWGRRIGHGRQARLIQDESQGFWAWLGSLLVDEDRGRVVAMSAGSPWGLMGPPNFT